MLRGGVHCIVSGTRYAPVDALPAILYLVSICCSQSDVAGWYLYDFTTGHVHSVLERDTDQGWTCPGSEPRSRIGPLTRDGGDWMAVAMERVIRETDLAVAEECRRWNWAAKAREKVVDESPAEDVPAGQENAAAAAGQEAYVVVIEYSVA